MRTVALAVALDRLEIKRRIAEARDEAGLTQEELGDALSPPVHFRTVQTWESLRNDNVPFKRIAQIAMVTGKSSEWLLHGEAGEPVVAPVVMPTPTMDVMATLAAELARDPGRALRLAPLLLELAASFREAAEVGLGWADRLERLARGDSARLPGQ
jgi:transcriptional regulator with XRE-family HTH domain